MTPAVKLLDKLKVAYQLHQYQHDDNAPSYGLEAAEKLSVNSQRIFKTLVVEAEANKLAVAIVPVDKQLQLKAMATSIGSKKTSMADPKKVQSSTGYVLGGVSPLGQKKQLKTIIDASAKQFNSIFVSGGKRGLEIEISPLVIAEILKANFCDIAI